MPQAMNPFTGPRRSAKTNSGIICRLTDPPSGPMENSLSRLRTKATPMSMPISEMSRTLSRSELATQSKEQEADIRVNDVNSWE